MRRGGAPAMTTESATSHTKNLSSRRLHMFMTGHMLRAAERYRADSLVVGLLFRRFPVMRDDDGSGCRVVQNRCCGRMRAAIIRGRLSVVFRIVPSIFSLIEVGTPHQKN